MALKGPAGWGMQVHLLSGAGGSTHPAAAEGVIDGFCTTSFPLPHGAVARLQPTPEVACRSNSWRVGG
jgi:hypothetical protein